MDEREKALSAFRWFDTQRVLFVITFLFGAVGIVFIREYGYSVLYAVIYAVCLMAIYVVLGGTKQYFVRTDILGDNTYYLGFLFTLVSLAYTLYRYESTQAQVAIIIQNFGLALSTTLFGLLGRVYFSQTREDPAVYQAAVRISLAEQAASLIGETAQIRQDLSVLRVSIKQSIEEGTKGALDGFGLAVSEETRQFGEQISRVSTTVDEAIAKSIESFASSVATVNASVEESSRHYLSLLQRNAASTSVALDFAITKFSEASKRFGDLIEDAVLRIEPNLNDLNNEIKRQVAAVKRVTASMEGLQPIDEMLGEYLETPLRNADTALQEIRDSVAKASSAVDSFSANVGTTSTQLTSLADTNFTKFSQEMGGVNRSLEATIEALRSVVEGFSAVASANHECLKQLPEDMRTFRDHYRDAGEDVRRASRDSLDSLLALQNSLVNVANTITSAVEPNGAR